MVEFNALFDRAVCLYDYAVAGSDKASIDTQVDDGGNGALALPTLYRVLEIFMVAKTDDAAATAGLNLNFNNDTGAKYDRQTVAGTNATAAAAQSAAQTAYALGAVGSGAGGSYPMAYTFVIPNYGATTFHKIGHQIDTRFDTATAGNCFIRVSTIGFRDTAAISRVKVAAQGAAKLKVGSRLTIYGR